MKNVLCATDFSDNSVMALKYAEEICSVTKSNLIVINVFDLPTILNSPTEAPTFPQIEDDAEEHINQKITQFCNNHLNKVDFTADSISDNSVVEGIISKAAQHSADLIVVGVNGHGKFHEIVMGRTAKGLIKESISPVLAIPPNVPLKLFKETIYATDFEEEDIEAIKRLVNIVKPFDGKMNVIHVAVKDEFSDEEKMARFKDMLIKQLDYPRIEFSVQLAGNVVNRIEYLIKTRKPSLLVMLEREHPHVRQWIQKDVVMSMLVKSSIPLLIYNERNLALSTKIHGKIN